MRISFDLDGVVTNSEKWFFGVLSTLRQVHNNKEVLDTIELLYYSTRSVKYNPHLFMSSGDGGYIITARKPISHQVTEQWLTGNGIELEVIYVDSDDTIDWLSYEESSYESAERKAEVLGLKGITTHLDNNPFIVTRMRQIMPSASIIQIGGEPCLSSS